MLRSWWHTCPAKHCLAKSKVFLSQLDSSDFLRSFAVVCGWSSANLIESHRTSGRLHDIMASSADEIVERRDGRLKPPWIRFILRLAANTALETLEALLDEQRQYGGLCARLSRVRNSIMEHGFDSSARTLAVLEADGADERSLLCRIRRTIRDLVVWMACEEVGFDSRERFLARFSSILTPNCSILTSMQQLTFKSQLLNSYHQGAAKWAAALDVHRFAPNVATRKRRKNKLTRDSEGRDRHQMDHHPSASSSSSSLPQWVDVNRTSSGLRPRPAGFISPSGAVDPWQLIHLLQRRIQELGSQMTSREKEVMSLRRQADFFRGLATGDGTDVGSFGSA